MVSMSKPRISWLSKVLIFSLLLSYISFVMTPGASAIALNSNSLRVGCYHFTDILLYTRADEVFTQSTFPDAYLGKSMDKVKCTESHHLEISTILKSKIANSLRLDGILLKTKCIVGNIKLLNSDHANHKAELYFKVYRKPGSKTNLAICGVLAPSYSHPNKSNYKIYENFLSPHFKIESMGNK